MGQISSIKTENIRQGDTRATFGIGPAAAVRLTAGYFVRQFHLKTLKHVFFTKWRFYYLRGPNCARRHAQKVPFTHESTQKENKATRNAHLLNKKTGSACCGGAPPGFSIPVISLESIRRTAPPSSLGAARRGEIRLRWYQT